MKVVEIRSNPAPDAEERLRRLFTLLVKIAARNEPVASGKDSQSESHAEVED